MSAGDSTAEARAREVLAQAFGAKAGDGPDRIRSGHKYTRIQASTAIRAMLDFSAEQNTGGMPGRDIAGLDAGLVKRLRDRLAMATQGEWQLQDGCSWRRIGTQFHDGNVLCPTTYSARDNHPDLTAGKGESLYANLTLIVEAVNALPALLNAADAILSLAATGGTGAGEGWRLVPIKPTEAMLLAAGCTPDGVTPRGGIDRMRRMLPRWWRAMLNAAPTTPTGDADRG